MASASALPEPLRVSPLIRVSRWSLLGLGIMWGITRHRSNKKKEDHFRACEEAARPAREAAQAAEKQKLYREEMLYLAKETGAKVPEGF